MNAVLRVCACAAVLTGAVLFIGLALVPWLGGPSLFPNDLREIYETIVEQSRRRDDLSARNRVVFAVLEQKRDVVADLADGRASLAEAVSTFRRLHEEVQSVQNDGPNTGRPAVEISDEALAREVIAWVRAAVSNDPRRDEILCRLEAELAAMGRGKPAV
jgi:hypothetical protein